MTAHATRSIRVLLVVALGLFAKHLFPNSGSDSLKLVPFTRDPGRFGLVGGIMYAEGSKTSHFTIYTSNTDHGNVQPFLGCWYASGHARTHVVLEVAWERQQWLEHYSAPPFLSDRYTSGYIRKGKLSKSIDLLRFTQVLAFPLNKGWQLRTGFDLGIPIQVHSEDITARRVSAGYNEYYFPVIITVPDTISSKGRDLVSNHQLALRFGIAKEFTFGWIISTSASIGFTDWATVPDPDKRIPFFGHTSIGKTLFGPRKRVVP